MCARSSFPSINQCRINCNHNHNVNHRSLKEIITMKIDMRFEFSDRIRKLLHFVSVAATSALPPSSAPVCPRPRAFYSIHIFVAMHFDLFFGCFFLFFFFCWLLFVRIQHVACRHLASAVIWNVWNKSSSCVCEWVGATLNTDMLLERTFWTNILVHSNCSYSGASNTHLS